MSNSSDLQMGVFGAYGLGAGLVCIIKPELSLFLFKPLTVAIERLTGLPGVVLNDQTGPMIASFGGLASAIGFYYLRALATGDEKFKRNTILGRYFFSALCFGSSAFTTRGSSFIVAIGLVDFIAASIMGSTIGFSDTSAVSKRK